MPIYEWNASDTYLHETDESQFLNNWHKARLCVASVNLNCAHCVINWNILWKNLSSVDWKAWNYCGILYSVDKSQKSLQRYCTCNQIGSRYLVSSVFFRMTARWRFCLLGYFHLGSKDTYLPIIELPSNNLRWMMDLPRL